MKLKTHRTDSKDPEFVDLEQIKEELKQKPQDLSGFVTKEDLEIFKKQLVLGLFLEDGVFNLNAPISIISTKEVEKKYDQEGLLYYDIINEVLRFRTKDGWKTVKTL